MKRLVIVLGMSAALLAWLTSPTLAFHDEGVARCNGCHTMHNSENGQLVDPDSPNGNEYLLKDAKATDVCLSCHATSLGAVWATDPLNPGNRPGGNFCFLLEDNINDGYRGGQNPIPGSYGGHNVIAPSRNSGADPVVTRSPGGNYPSSAMSCTSCHDPHGNEHFRLLYGIGHVEAGDYTFTNRAPTAEAISLNSNEANNLHTAYQSGMSAWCANCHGNFHQNTTQFVHPSGVAMGASIAQTYNQYNGTADQNGGNQATAFLAATPFEDPAMTTTSRTGPTGTSQISCITCHRAHGSSAPNIGRWDFNIPFLSEDGVESGSYAIPDPYNNVNQRSLCNKCHNKDEGDGNPN